MLNTLDDIYIHAKARYKGSMPLKIEADCLAFIHFLKCALIIDPNQRWTAKMLLFHPFIQDTDMQNLSIPQIESIRKESIDTTSSIEYVCSINSHIFNKNLAQLILAKVKAKFFQMSTSIIDQL